MSCYLVKVKKEEPDDSKINIKVERKSSLHHYSSSSSCTTNDIKPVFIKHEIKKEEYDSDCDCNDCRVAQGNVIRVTIDDVVLSTTQNQTDQHEADCGCSDCVQNDQVLDRDQANQGANQSVDLTDEPTGDNASRSSTPDWKPSIFSSDDDETEDDDETTQDESDDYDNYNDSKRKPRFITVHLNCMDCCKTFKTREELKGHQLKTHRIQRFRCLVKDCSASFGYNLQLNHHQSVKHQNCQTWPCRICDNQLKTYPDLVAHFRLKHQKGRFVCVHTGCTVETDTIRDISTHTRLPHSATHRCSTSGCNKQFNARIALLEHEQKHSGDRPFACTQCDKCYTSNQQLKSHIRGKHQSRKPYSCKWESCQHENSYLGGMHRHVRTHFKKAGDDVKRETNDFIERYYEPVMTVFGNNEMRKNSS